MPTHSAPSLTKTPSAAASKSSPTPWDLGVRELPAGVCYPDTGPVRLDHNGRGGIVSQWMRRKLTQLHYGSDLASTWLHTYAPAVGHLTGAQSPEVALGIVCGIDDSNGYFFQVVVLQRPEQARDWHLLALLPVRDPPGARGANVTRIVIERRHLIVHELTHHGQDAHCCPRLRATAEWVYAKGSLTPTAATARMHPESPPL